MKKLIIEDITFKIENKEEEKNFIDWIKKMKKDLKESNNLPTKFSLFRDIDKDKDIFKLYLVFDSDEDFDKWDAKVPQKNKDDFRNELGKYFVKYNYSEKIDID
ncbi:MAG: hypothetical protein HPAVJP_0680 [Candidatus Hepatoplasma vulgare]|nr:MAG: hypothetical protein HPAVJP_0680 [Candidatus Hepatoplasma sp.]